VSATKQIRVLYVTRKFPPKVGGMEALSAGIADALGSHFPTTVIAWGRSQLAVPLFVVWAIARAAALSVMGRIDHVHVGDVLLAPIGLFLARLFSRTVTVTAHGLDVTWPFPGYQALVIPCLRRVDGVVAISRSTLEECTRRGVSLDRCVVIPPGVATASALRPPDREELGRIAGIPLANQRVLITVGRLVPRKGVRWFVEAVMPQLPEDFVYLVIGDGPEASAINSAIAARGLGDRVRLLGRVPREIIDLAYASSDLFVMPNLDVPGDVEGFGIVAIEAGQAGLPVVAANLQGIADAVLPGTGRLVDTGSAEQFRRAIRETLAEGADRTSIRERVDGTFAWPVLAERWAAFISSVHVRSGKAGAAG
jgi:phosphatidyl-myo-inositol dimannoside synthase